MVVVIMAVANCCIRYLSPSTAQSAVQFLHMCRCTSFVLTWSICPFQRWNPSSPHPTLRVSSYIPWHAVSFSPHFYNITYPEDTNNSPFAMLVPTCKPAQCYMSADNTAKLYGNMAISRGELWTKVPGILCIPVSHYITQNQQNAAGRKSTMTVASKLFGQYRTQRNWKTDLFSVCEVAMERYLIRPAVSLRSYTMLNLSSMIMSPAVKKTRVKVSRVNCICKLCHQYF